MRAVQALAALEHAASTQWGLLTSAQAEAVGVTRMMVRRLVNQGVLRRVRRGVYATPSAEGGPQEPVRAAWLAVAPIAAHADRPGSDVVVSHASAARLHGLTQLAPLAHEFTSARRRTSAHGDVRFHRRDIPAEDVVRIDGLPTTSVARTLADLGMALADDDAATVARRVGYGRQDGADAGSWKVETLERPVDEFAAVGEITADEWIEDAARPAELRPEEQRPERDQLGLLRFVRSRAAGE